MRKAISSISFKVLGITGVFFIIIFLLNLLTKDILLIEHCEYIFNYILLCIMIAIIVELFFIYVRKKIDVVKSKNEIEIRCIPLILWATALPLTFVGGLVFWKGFFIGIPFLIIGVVLWFESLIIKMKITENGIIVCVHKFFPFPGIFYSFNDLKKIKKIGPIIHLKHNQLFLGAKSYIVIDLHIFVREIKNIKHIDSLLNF